MRRWLLVLLAGVVLTGHGGSLVASQSRERDLVRVPNAATPKTGVPRGYALIIGIANYQNLDRAEQLRFPESDADAMYRVLISQEGGAFPPENVKFLKGSQATLQNIRRALEEWLPSVAQPADRVVVYFAGHGYRTLSPWQCDP